MAGRPLRRARLNGALLDYQERWVPVGSSGTFFRVLTDGHAIVSQQGPGRFWLTVHPQDPSMEFTFRARSMAEAQAKAERAYETILRTGRAPRGFDD